MKNNLMVMMGLLLAFGLAVPVVRADEQFTKMTFDQEVKIPGQVLPAGTYWFMVKSGPNFAGIDTVQIYNADKSDVVATVHSNQAERPNATGDTVVSFAERSTSEPAAMLTWYYPGRTDGHQFAYSRYEEKHLQQSAQKTLQSDSNGRVLVSSLNAE